MNQTEPRHDVDASSSRPRGEEFDFDFTGFEVFDDFEEPFFEATSGKPVADAEAKGNEDPDPPTTLESNRPTSTSSTTSSAKPVGVDAVPNKSLSVSNRPISSSKPGPASTSHDILSGPSASLLHRLAGPSTGKAGLAKDQTEITRIIAEASEGSKFYLNEKRKDEELSKKISALLKTRDELLQIADLASLTAHADKILQDLASTRILSQYIVHLDMDSFYASVEVLSNPSLAGKPFGVGGPSDGGVLSTASYEARKWGVRSGMATYIAQKLCPGLIIVKSNFKKYTEVSGVVMDILREYDPNMDPAGADEAYANITEYCTAHSVNPEDCVQEIRTRIFQDTKLTASAGIAANKMLAKICSEKNKPNGQFRLPNDAEKIMEFMKDLPIRRIPGIGRVSERLLSSIGIQTCGDIHAHRATLALLDKHFHLREKLAIYLGLGSTNVRPWPREARKSVGSERTFHATSDKEVIEEKLDYVCKELEEDLERLGYAGHTVTLKIKLDSFEVRSRAKTVHRPVKTYDELIAIGKDLLAHEMPLTLRLLGLRITGLKDLKAPEMGIKRFFIGSSERPAKRRKLADDQEEATYIPSSDSSSDDDVDGMKRAVSATPERPCTQTDAKVDVGKRASSCDPPGSQEYTSGARLLLKRKLENGKKSSAASTSKDKPTNPRKANAERHICPICSKMLQVDNSGLNEHIDWCLSKGAILEASAAGDQDPPAPIKTVNNKGSLGGFRRDRGEKSGSIESKRSGSKKGKNKTGKGDIWVAWKTQNQ